MMQITGDTGESVVLQMLVMPVCVCLDDDDGCIWMPVAELCHFCAEVCRRRERESMCQSYIHAHTL